MRQTKPSELPLLPPHTSVLVLISRANPKSHSLTVPLALQRIPGRQAAARLSTRRQQQPAASSCGSSTGVGRPAAAVHQPRRQASSSYHHHSWQAGPPDQDVLRLHVAVDDAIGVQVVQRAHQLASHAAHHRLRQAAVVLQDVKQLTCRQEE